MNEHKLQARKNQAETIIKIWKSGIWKDILLRQRKRP